ncbi:rod shape-determining protein RodA [Candidatus Berkelbacteria bacterium]|nr:rod shape-determining protein RodA [Candidatus Berkelbacteria bacterium]
MRFQLLRFIDWYLVGIVLILVVGGVAMIYSLTFARSGSELAFTQGAFVILGWITASILAVFDYRRLRSFSLLLYLAVGLLLLGVTFYGTVVFGARRWIEIGAFQLQPSELFKLVAVILIARVLAARFGAIRFRDLFVVSLLLGLPITLVLKQPDLGTAGVIFLTFVIILTIAKLPRSLWVSIGLSLPILMLAIFLNLKDYQIDRVQVFLNPASDRYGSGYNVLQSLIAVGNGGLFGQGLGQGTQSQLDFLPVIHTDFIFAGMAEAVGFFGSFAFLVLFAALIIRALMISHRAPDAFGSFLAFGIASLWFVQLAINVGMNLGLAPVTGIPLPFISYGGTAIVCNFIALGILESIAIRSQQGYFRTY